MSLDGGSWELETGEGSAPPAARLDVLRLEMKVHREIRYQIIHPARPVFDLQESTLAQIVHDRPCLFVMDRTVMSSYGEDFFTYARAHLQLSDVLLIDGDEVNKTWRQAELICEAAMACKLGRHGVIVGVGGGVILDVAGFSASIYRRGVSYLRIPTTLIGQVDVSVGVKQGVNSGTHKNILGSFHPPLASINDVTFLKSLPSVQLAAGFAEILKIAMIRDAALFDLVETHAETLLLHHFSHPQAAARLIMERAEVGMLTELRDNLFEIDLRRAVDFGHSFSPMLEAASAYTLPHGYAVALDMLFSTRIALARGLCTDSLLARLVALYARIGLPLTQHFCTAQVLHKSLDAVRAHRGGDLNLVVPCALGSAGFLQDVSLAEVERAVGPVMSVPETYADAGF